MFLAGPGVIDIVDDTNAVARVVDRMLYAVGDWQKKGTSSLYVDMSRYVIKIFHTLSLCGQKFLQ